MKRLIFTLLFVVFSTALGSKNQAHDISSHGPQIAAQVIDAIVAEQKVAGQLNAVVYTVWHQGHEVTTQAMGAAMPGVPASTKMHFRIGGITQLFLSTLLMRLSEEGVLHSTDKVAKWFPNYPAADQVTLKMLAHNSAGYFDYMHAKKFLNAFYSNPFRVWKTEELLNFAFTQPMVFKPGSKVIYSHTNWIIIGQILEKATGKTMPELIKHYITDPIGLHQTYWPKNASIRQPVLHGYDQRENFEDTTFWSPSSASYSGLMISTIKDLGHWAMNFGQGTLISRELAEKQRHIIPGERIDTGLGFFSMNQWLLQNPHFNGYQGVFAYYPKTKTAIIVFTTNGPNTPTGKRFDFETVLKIAHYLGHDIKS